MEPNIYIQALDAEENGDWNQAHTLVQDMVTMEAAWVHAYLHRVEGDAFNAEYWYNRAARPVCTTSLVAERAMLREELAEIGRRD